MKKLSTIALIFSFMLSCKKDETLSVPVPATVTTTALTEITSTSVTSGGNITHDGESEIIERGICFSTTTQPTTEHNKVSSGSGSGSFTTKISGLREGTTYYIRAYAMNCAGTAYGNEWIFFTPYREVVIGTQTWMLKNLDVATFRNGDPIPQVTDPVAWAALTTGAWCWYNNDSVTFGSVYGRLYNWYAVNDPRGLAPKGWHVPSDGEWATLTAFLGGNQIAGHALKESGTSHWNDPNEGATNSSGFTALPGGSRGYSNGHFYGILELGHWWTSTEVSSQAYYRWLTSQISTGAIFNGEYPKRSGFSVRCIKD